MKSVRGRFEPKVHDTSEFGYTLVEYLKHWKTNVSDETVVDLQKSNEMKPVQM